MFSSSEGALAYSPKGATPMRTGQSAELSCPCAAGYEQAISGVALIAHTRAHVSIRVLFSAACAEWRTAAPRYWRSDMANKHDLFSWYDGTALDAATFYAETFPDSAVTLSFARPATTRRASKAMS